MRFTVHAKHNREPIERRFASAIEATSEAWRLLAAGATGVYIFDDNTGKAYWPDGFAELPANVVRSAPTGPRRLKTDRSRGWPLADPRTLRLRFGAMPNRSRILTRPTGITSDTDFMLRPVRAPFVNSSITTCCLQACPGDSDCSVLLGSVQ
jgi:hypothetical protein